LIKRCGGKFITELKSAGGTIYAPGFFDNGKWFSIFRDKVEQYLGVIKGAQIYIWDIQTGEPKTVTMVGGAASYLTGTKPEDYHLLSINDFTYVTNRTKVVSAQAAPAAWVNNYAFISVRAIVTNSTYKVTINGNTATYNTPTSGVIDIDTVCNGIVSAINGLGISGLTATVIGPGIMLSRSSTFSISVRGGVTGDAIEVMQKTVPNISKLPTQCQQNYIAQVKNTSGEEDDYYVKFIADNGVSGPGIWEETIRPDVSPGLQASTMPHELVRMGDGSFQFREVSWEPRLVGDDESNPFPSFYGQTIQQMFFYRDRLGALTYSTVALSQAGDYFNYFISSALTSVDSDPIDVNTSTTKPAAMRAVVPVSQGLVLMSTGEQFLLSSSNDSLTPGSVVVKSISRYQYDISTDPADLGVTSAFVTKSSAYTRVFEMETLGSDVAPFMNDITKIVPEWIPSNISLVAGSGQSSLLALGSPASPDVYLFQFLSDGQKRLKESWFQWKLSGSVQYHTIESDVYWAVTEQEDSYVIQSVNLIQSPASSSIQSTDGSRVDPRLDHWRVDVAKVLSGTDTKVYLGFVPDSTKTIQVVVANSTTNGPDYTNSGTIYTPSTIAQDGTGWYALIENEDLTAEKLIVGYSFDYIVELPAIYYRTGDDKSLTDYTAFLSVARIKFNFGLSGEIGLKVEAAGREVWETTAGVNKLNTYRLNDIPFLAEGVFTLPIYQRSENFRVSVTSTSPFPVSLLSAMWEGNYSPKFYKRGT
jgi:hypothetical protein